MTMMVLIAILVKVNHISMPDDMMMVVINGNDNNSPSDDKLINQNTNDSYYLKMIKIYSRIV